MADDITNEENGKSDLISNSMKGKIEIPLDKRGYNEAPAVKIERPKPSPTPPPTRQD